MKDATNNKIALQGYELVREKYLHGKGSDGKSGKLNELMMHLIVHEGDDRPASVQGRVKISLDEVKVKRPIIMTTKPYDMRSFRDVPPSMYPSTFSDNDVKRDIFDRGPLVCRWSLTTIVSPNGTTYGGIMRLLSGKETETARSDRQHVPNRQNHIPIAQEPAATPARLLREPRLGKRPARTPSLEFLSIPPSKRGRSTPTKSEKFTYVDICCGAGGSSRGATQADLQVIAGLDFDELAMEAWTENNPGGLPYNMDVWEFDRLDLYKVVGRPHICSISNPCRPFSAAQ
jgi:DNA (cytosine-5)-methyltransferase 1